MDVLRATEVKSFTVSLVCFLIFLVPSVPAPVAFLLFLTANAALLVGFFCSFDPAVPLRALVAIGVLATAAVAYLWVGALALRFPSGAELIFLLSGAYAAAVLGGYQAAEAVAVETMTFSLIGLTAAMAMTKRRKIGYGIWLVIIVILIASDLWVLGAALVSGRNSSARDGPFFPFGWWPLLLPLVYAFAYAVAVKGIELK